MNNINNFVGQLVKKCIPFLSCNDSKLENKYYNLNLLCTIWKEDTEEDFTADVYASVAEMFASNVFRPLPRSSYTAAADDEATAAAAAAIGILPVMPDPVENPDEIVAEYQQTSITNQAFQTFIDRRQFDPDRASQFLDRRFVNGLVHRLNSGNAYERLTIRDTMARSWYACPSVREHMLDAAVAELADFAYGYRPLSRHNGVDDLLDFLTDNVDYEDIRQESIDKLCRVLTHLLKHPFLSAFKSKLIECVKVLDGTQKELIPRMLLFIMKLLSFQNSKTIALLNTVTELYNCCDKDKWVPLQLRVVGPLSKLFSNDDFKLADEAMNLWNLILQENIIFWQTNQDDVRMVVNALKKVTRTHWNSECVKVANSLLDSMVMKNVIKDSRAEDPEEMFQEGKTKMNYNCTSKHIQNLKTLKLSSTLSSSMDMPTTNT